MNRASRVQFFAPYLLTFMGGISHLPQWGKVGMGSCLRVEEDKFRRSFVFSPPLEGGGRGWGLKKVKHSKVQKIAPYPLQSFLKKN